MTSPLATKANGRDEAIEMALSNLLKKRNHVRSEFTTGYEVGFGEGWDARDEQLLKLHGEGAMADVIRLQQEVNQLKDVLEAVRSQMCWERDRDQLSIGMSYLHDDVTRVLAEQNAREEE